MENSQQRIINGHQNCFAFDSSDGKHLKCKALHVHTVKECLKCKFFKTQTQHKAQQTTIAKKIGFKF